jgi:inner membrane protein involved in colicin E2 resistance
MSYNPVKNVDFNSLPNYAIANIPILTYALLGITTLTLGYITIKDKEAENGTIASSIASATTEVSAVVAPVTAIPETPLEKGGKKRKQTKSNNKKTKKQK